MAREESPRTAWTFVTNHARVLAMIARDPDVRLRDVAVACRLTERAVQAIVADLEQAGYLAHTRTGRRNRYQVAAGTTLRHPAEHGLSVAALLDMLDSSSSDTGTAGDHEASQTAPEAQDQAPPARNGAEVAAPVIGGQSTRGRAGRRTDRESPHDG